VEENPQEPFETIEPQIAEILSRISTVICVFLEWNDARRAFVERLLEQGAAVKVILVSDEAGTGDALAVPDATGPVSIITRERFEKGVDEL
jgi:hypothetical protein